MTNRTIMLTIEEKTYPAEVPDDERFELHGCLWFFKTPSGTDYSINLGRNDWLPLVAAYAAMWWKVKSNRDGFRHTQTCEWYAIFNAVMDEAKR